MILIHFVWVLTPGEFVPRWATVLIDVLDGRAAVLFVILAGVGVT